MKSKLMACICTLFVLYACSSENEESLPAFIEVSPAKTLQYEYQGGEDTLVVDCNKEWEISGETDWCHVSRLANTNPQQVVVHVSEVKEKGDRSTTLLFSCEGVSTSVAVKQFGTVETGYFDMGFEKEGVTVNYEKSTGVVTAHYESEVPVLIRTGKTIVLPGQYDYEIRVIESVEISGKQVVLQTLAGNMCDLFHNTEFVLSTDPALGSGNAILPTEVGYLAKDGVYHKLEEGDKKASTLFSVKKEFEDDEISNQTGKSLVYEKYLLDMGLKGTFSFKFGEKETRFGKKGELEKFSLDLEGDLKNEVVLKYDFKQDFQLEENEVIEENFVRSYVYRFMVGATPVIILARADLSKHVSVDAKKTVTATVGCQVSGSVNMGLEWQKGREMISRCEYTPDIMATPSVHEIAGSFSGEIAYSPVLRFDIYNFSGSWLNPVPYLKEEVKSDARNYGADCYVWNSECWSGLGVQMGAELNFGIENMEEWESEYSRVCEDKILEAPKKVELISSPDTVQALAGEPIKAEFQVSSYNLTTQRYEPCSGVPVVFEAENGLSHMVQVSDAQGKVAILWKPENLETPAELKAGIAGLSGEYVDVALLCATLEQEMQIAEMVDLGLSVKWASWNIGAAAAEEYGDAFAWGEMEEKLEYNLKNYAFGKDLNGDGNISWDELENIGDIENTQYDVAKAKWGGTWRMPTSEEMNELLKECKWEWTSLNGVNGRKVTGPNGNSIFLPATGQYDEGGLRLRGSQGFYWSGTLTTSYSTHNKADRLYFCSSSCRYQDDYRYYGGFIRPVSE